MSNRNSLLYGIAHNDYQGKVTFRENGKKLHIPEYARWTAMLARCYGKSTQRNQPSYIGCEVSVDWLYFSNFKVWMGEQDWEGKQLDKDLLFVDNKVYSENTCVFINQLTNLFITERGRSSRLIGACFVAGKYKADCRDPFKRVGSHLGMFETEEEAHLAWLNKKLEYAHEVIELEKDIRVKEAVINRYLNYYKNSQQPFDCQL